jgi:ABC-2 type transport system ATP-binding protein
VHDLQVDGTRVRCQVDSAQLDEVLRHLSAAGVRSLTSQPPTLEELFLRHYQAEEATTDGNGRRRTEGVPR